MRGGSDHAPWFVARKDLARNALIVVQGHGHPWLLSKALVAGDPSWVAGSAPGAMSMAAKTRYRQADAACEFDAAPRQGGDVGSGDGPTFRLRFDQPQWAVTPGQSAVLYAGEVCLGGGVIGAAL